MRAGRSGIGPIHGIDTSRLTVKIAAEIPDFEPEAHFDCRQLLALDRNAQLAVVAAREAMAGVDMAGLAPERAGVVMGAALGQLTVDAGYQSFYGEGARTLPPMTVPRGMPNAATSQIAMAFGCKARASPPRRPARRRHMRWGWLGRWCARGCWISPCAAAAMRRSAWGI